jgi:hypothetical protein
MSRQAWMAGVWWCLVVALLLMNGRVFAQNEEAGGAGVAESGPVRGEVVSIGIGGVEGKGGLYRPGAWVPVRVRLENRSGKVVTGRLGVEQPDLDGDKAMSVGAKFVLEPSAEPRDFWLYYWPRPDDGTEGSVKRILVLDETGTGQPVATISAPHGAAAADRIEPKDFETGRSARWVVVLGSKAVGFENFWKAWGGTEGVRMSLLPSANDLPDNVLGLDGVDVIVWEADEIKPSDLAPEFQMKAMLDWVEAGGHLIITAGQQADELKRAARLKDALPMEITGTREVDAKDVAGLTWTGNEFATKGGKISQLVGTIRGDFARPVQGTAGGAFAEHPLAVTGVYGRGAVTLLTVNAAAPEMTEGLRGDMAMKFWDQIAGWSASDLKTDAEYQREQNLPDTQRTKEGVELRVGKGLSSLIDVTEVTQVRLLVAVLFLAVYWLLAGPIGYLILRAYKVAHWSWWVFGGTVVAASGLAAGVVMVLHLTNYDLRHKTVVLGVVNRRGVTAIGYYGIFAPASGQLTVEEPYSGGLSYLAPLCEPTDEPVQPFADPQSYVLYDDRAWGPSPVFRNTLKKMEGRWTGEREGLEGHAEVTRARGAVLYNNATFTGELTNHTGYDLERVQVIVGGWNATSERTQGYVYDVDLGKGVKWGNGQKIDLATTVKPELGTHMAGMGAMSLDDELRGLADQYSQAPSMLGYGTRFMAPAPAPAVDEGNDLLYVLLDAMLPRNVTDSDRRNAVRGLARGMDATKLLDAAGGLVIARAGNLSKKEFVDSPVALRVNGKPVAGRGDVLFVWALPLKAPGVDALNARGGGGAGAGAGGAGQAK